MFYEGDLNPVVKRVSPYRTLIINLPPKAFGFWVLANTKIEACHDIENSNKTFIEANTVNKARPKRAVDDDIDDVNHVADISYDFEDLPNDYVTVNAALRRRINDMNKGLKINKGIFQRHQNSGRVKRNDVESSIPRGKWRIPSLKDKTDRKFHRGFIPRGLLHDLLERARETVDNLKNHRPRKFPFDKNRVIKRNSLYPRISSSKPRNYTNVKSKPKYLPKPAVHNNGTANTYKSNKNNSEKLGTYEEKPKNIKTNVRKRRNIDEDIQEIPTDIDGTSKAELMKFLTKFKAEINDIS